MFRCRAKKKKKKNHIIQSHVSKGEERATQVSFIPFISLYQKKKKKINDDHIMVAAKNRKPDVLTIGKMPKI